ncbi:hypothetical protein C6A85_09885, partial [Mycobacterium sp. ITM-2017-0098]
MHRREVRFGHRDGRAVVDDDHLEAAQRLARGVARTFLRPGRGAGGAEDRRAAPVRQRGGSLRGGA